MFFAIKNSKKMFEILSLFFGHYSIYFHEKVPLCRSLNLSFKEMKEQVAIFEA